MPHARTTASLSRLTEVAATLFQTPGATVVLSGEDGMVLHGGVNVCRDNAPKKASFTDVAMQAGQGAVLVVEDASRDPRFADNPVVSGPNHIRFYCGAVITLKDGRHAGALCALDVVPRERPDDAALSALRNLAAMAADILDRDAEFRRQKEELAMLGLAEAMSGVGHWQLDVESHVVTWSDEVYRIHGVDRGAFDPTYDDAVDFYHPEDRAEVRRQIEHVIATGAEMQFELRLIPKDGQERIVQSRAAAELGPNGKVATIFGVFRDVTEERRALHQISRSEARYRLLADNMADVISRVRADGSGPYISPAIEKLLGWRLEEMSGQSMDYVHPDDRPKVLAVIRAVLDGSSRTTIVHRALHRDGRVIWVESRFQRVEQEDGPSQEAIVVIRDVSERKVLEDQLQAALEESRESADRYRILAERSEDIIITYGYDTMVTYASPSLERITGIKPEDMVGTTVNRLLHPEDAKDVNLKLAAFIRDHPDQDMTTQRYRAYVKSGEVRHYETRTRIVRDDEGKVLEIQDMARDVTETRRLDEELREALVQVEAAAQAKSEFLANMSHELRTPLTSVVGFAGLLKTSEDLTDEDRRHVDRIATGSEALLSVINDILDYSKLEAEALEMDPHPFHLWDFAQGAGDLMEAQRADKGLELEVMVDPAAPEAVLGDEGRLRQVTLNFLSNAMKFTAKGKVALQVGGAATAEGGWRLRVAVSDTGMGIEPDKLEALFERFTQADQSTTRHFGGTGLGLAISKRLIEAMGGEIGAESVPEQGSTFWFEVPLDVAKAAMAVAPEPSAMPERSARILVADDAAANRELVSTILTQLGAEAEVACDGAEALAAVQVADFDLVLMDMHMPEMDGPEATRRIRALGGAFARLPIIALTANVQREQIQKCLDAGMDGHVGKPINIAELARTVADWLERGREGGGARVAA